MNRTIGSLCSGIGGLELGLERAGVGRTIWQAETNPFCSRVLAKHWPGVPNHGDITTIDWSTVERPDILCGGYPCQPFSLAGKRDGADDERHLWPAFVGAIRVLRPEFVVLENVAGHLSLGLNSVLGDLAGLGFDADWSIVSAAEMGASHRRDRVFVVAYPHGEFVRIEPPGVTGRGSAPLAANDGAQEPLADAARDDGLLQGTDGARTVQHGRAEPRGGRCDRSRPFRWLPEPALDRVADGLPSSVVRPQLKALGNAVVPQVAEFIGSQLLAVLDSGAHRGTPQTARTENADGRA